MPGMRSGLNVTNSTLVAAFKAALLHQGLIILAILAVLALAWIIAREWLPAAAPPARGGWAAPTGGRRAAGGALTSMVQSMSGTPQPAFLSAWLNGFGSFVAAHGFVVNLAAVILLAAIGAGLLSRQPRLTQVAVIVLVAVCLADWVLVEDLGFLGGLGTDPNSMIPFALLVAGGSLALTGVPAAAGLTAADRRDAAQPVAAGAAAGMADTDVAAQPPIRPGWRERAQAARLAPAVGGAGTAGERRV